MGSLVLTVCYLSAVVFLVAIVYRAARIARLPIHLRWELYPVAHEKGRATYGGSYLEESNWWTKPRQSSLAGEMKVMIPEILLLAGVWEHNRTHWFRSFPFHFGLYILFVLVILLLTGGIAVAVGISVSPSSGPLASALFHLTYLTGYTGLGLGMIGALALLVRRTFNADYREYTKKADYFNLVFFVVTLLVGLLAHALEDPYFVGLRSHFAKLVTLGGFSAIDIEAAAPMGHLITAEIILASALLAYIPLTHMSHFFIKYFTYHHVRWSDEPNMRGSRIERKVAAALQYPVSWSAPHIRGDGKKTWVDVATEGVEEKEA